jgi:PAS domain S-box-containing protein
LVACWYWIRKLQARFHAGDYAQAVAASATARRLLHAIVGLFEEADYHFFTALARAAALDSATPDERRDHSEALAQHHKRLALWAEQCPANFADRAAMIGAEIARLEGRELDAEGLYEQAIRFAREQGFVQNEGLAFELAARFYAARGFEAFVELYIRRARYCYQRWGADGKVRQLNELYPRLRENEPALDSQGTSGAPVEQLDLATVLKVSQTVSGEMILDRLLERLMRAAIEHAGAERGVLIAPRGDELQIQAQATARGADVTVDLRDSDRAEAALPQSLVRYVMRTRETVIIDDASSQNLFSADPYLIHHRARSILCLPLVNQGSLIGVLYLENNLAPRVFGPARIAVLKLLASQAAMSLENTRLYRDLAQREARIRRLVDADIVGIFIWDFDGTIHEANDAFLRELGHEREDLVAGRLRWTDFSAAQSGGRDRQDLLAEIERTGSLQPFEWEHVRKDGSRVPVLVGAAIFEGEKQGVAFVLDLTERKRAEQALRKSEAYLAEAQQLAHLGSWAWSPDTDLSYWSEECYRVLGFDPRDGLPRFEDFIQRIHADDQPGFRELIETAIRGKAEWATDYRIVHPDGSVRDIHFVAHPVLSTSGHLVEFVGTVIDVTERKLAEQERARLRELEADLAHINRVSTLGEMAAMLAHEVKQPIATARNNARAALNFLAKEPPDLGEVREALGCIVGDADRAGDIFDRIRAHIKKAPPRKDRFDLNEAITEVVELVQSAIAKHGMSLEMRLADELYAVQGDRVQLQQVILNLTLNAVEAMSTVDGPRELLISTEQGQTHGVVTVRDSGPGINPEKRECVFETFYTTKSTGVGIGLSICRSIIDAHGGRLWLEANEPRGATFQFTVPSAASELRSSSQSLHQTREPYEDSVPDAAHQGVSASNTRLPHLARGPRRRHWDKTS